MTSTQRKQIDLEEAASALAMTAMKPVQQQQQQIKKLKKGDGVKKKSIGGEEENKSVERVDKMTMKIRHQLHLHTDDLDYI